MTGQQLFDLAVGRMGITPSNATSYADTIIAQINTVLAENFTLENNVREFLNETLVTPLVLLTTIPEISALNTALTYQDDVLKNVVAWNLCQQLAVSDGEFALANYFGDKYEAGKKNTRKFIAEEILDWASGEE